MNNKAETFLRMHNTVLESLELIRKSGNAHSDTYNTLLKMEKRLLELSVINLEAETLFDI